MCCHDLQSQILIYAMDWPQIEELAIDNCGTADEIVEKLPPRLRSLPQLESADTSLIEAMPDNTLTNLTWIGRHKAGDLESILQRPGATLQGLEFKCNELSCPSMHNSFDVSILPQLAPKLKHVSINIPCNSTWPLEALQVLALLPQLRSLEIYSQLQSECQQQKPEEQSREMWDYMKEHGEDYYTDSKRLQKPILDEDTAEELHLQLK